MFPSLFKATLPKNPSPGQEASYSAVFLFDEEAVASEEFAAMKQAVNNLIIEKVGADKARVLLKDGKIKTGLRYDIESSGYPSEFKAYIRAKSSNKPGVVDRFEDPRNPGKPVTIEDPSLIYSGALVRASVGLYWFDRDGNRGVGFGLNNVQKMGEGTRLDGRRNAEDEFGFLEAAKTADLAEGPNASRSDAQSLEDLLG